MYGLFSLVHDIYNYMYVIALLIINILYSFLINAVTIILVLFIMISNSAYSFVYHLSNTYMHGL